MKLVSVETPEKSVCKMTFSATAEELEAASNAVYERTRASYTIKGFAKGEADRAQIEADRGEHTFWYDAINDLMDKDVPALYDAALAEHGFHPVDEPSYDLVSVKKDEGFVATATVALQPELNLTQTTGFKTECVTPEVTDKEIDAVLERRRAMAAELVPHKGPAVKGNIVHIDYEGLLEGKPFNGGTAQNQTLQLGSGRMIPGFEEGILGHKGGEEFDIFVTFPARYHVKDLAGKPVQFTVKCIEVKEKKGPTIDDEFAKDVSEYDTLAALKKSIKADLAAKRQEAVDRDFENEAVVLAGKNMTCDIPACMIDEQVDKHLEQFAYQLQSQGMKMDDYLKMIGGDVKGMRDSMRPMAEQTVRSNILLSEIVHQENLDVTEEEVEEELKKMAEQYKMELDKIKEMVDVEAVKSDLKGRKAVKLIVDNAKPVEKEKKTAKKAAKKEDAAEAPAEEAKTEE